MNKSTEGHLMRKVLISTLAAATMGFGLSGCATLVGAGAGAAAVAATEGELLEGNLFSETNAGLFDTDRDGKFERNEYDAFGDNNFGVWDSNDDGWIAEDEFGLGWNNIGWDDDDGVFDTFDDDGNNYLDSNEFFDDEEFIEWDTNSDGFLGTDEWGF